MTYLFSSESVSEGHPDKIADQISDGLLDYFLAFDKQAKVAIETLVTTGQVFLAGEVNSTTWVDIQKVVREVIKKIGYNKGEYHFDGHSCSILSAIHGQSLDIYQGISQINREEQGAGDQGMVFGYATKESANYMPAAIELSHAIVKELSHLRKHTKLMPYLRPDAKAQVTLAYGGDSMTPQKIDSIVISTQHDPFEKDEQKMHQKISSDIKEILIPSLIEKLDMGLQNLFNSQIKYHINPTGKFVIGGPHGDTGLTGRKIIVDTYGGKGARGGGAFSGKDPSKVDRSAAYASRYIAKNMVAAGVSDELLIQVSYAIGLAEPVGVYVNTYGKCHLKLKDNQIAQKIRNIFDLRPFFTEKTLRLRNPIYLETAAYGHMGRTYEKKKKTFENSKKEIIEKEVELFSWEKLDLVSKIRSEFGI